MQRIEESIAGFASAGPLVIETCQSALVEKDGACADAQTPDQLLLHHCKDDESDDGQRQKLDESRIAQQNDCGNQRCSGDCELGESNSLFASSFSALLILKFLKSARIDRSRAVAAALWFA